MHLLCMARADTGCHLHVREKSIVSVLCVRAMLPLHHKLWVACFQTGCDVSNVSTRLWGEQPDTCQTGRTISDVQRSARGGQTHANVSLLLKHIHVGQTFKSCKKKKNQSSQFWMHGNLPDMIANKHGQDMFVWHGWGLGHLQTYCGSIIWLTVLSQMSLVFLHSYVI